MPKQKLIPRGFVQSEVIPHPQNPRKINKPQKINLGQWMAQYGDISGITINKRTKHTVAGNQRLKEIDITKAPIDWWHENTEPDHVGTLAYGVIYNIGKDKSGKEIKTPFHLRWVDWPEEVELQAMLIANKAGGQFDWDILSGFGEGLLLDTGFTAPELELHGIFEEKEPKNKPRHDGRKNQGSLVKNYIAPPFSVLHTTRGYWKERKAYWLEQMGEVTATKKGKLSGGVNYVSTINSGVSIFDPVLAECILLWFGLPGCRVYDPFSGRVFGFVAAAKGMDYLGTELREEQVLAFNQSLEGFKMDGHARCICANSVDYELEPQSMDLFVTDPPYLWLEKYSKLKDDLSNMKEKDFFAAYKTILEKSYAALKYERFAVVVVGEVRRKDGSYANLIGRTIEIMEQAGYNYYNEIIVVKPAGTLPFRVNKFMKTSRKVGKMHQNVLVFFKGDIKKIKTTFKGCFEDVEVMGEEEQAGEEVGHA